MKKYACPKHPDVILFEVRRGRSKDHNKGAPAVVVADEMNACPKCKEEGLEYYRYYKQECVLIDQKKG